MSDIPSWHIVGDWFDNCSCAVACPCTFAQIPDNGFCESVLFWHIRHGNYGDVKLDDLSFIRVGRWEGDLWGGKDKGAAGLYIDERADDRHYRREASTSHVTRIIAPELLTGRQLNDPHRRCCVCPSPPRAEVSRELPNARFVSAPPLTCHFKA
jgi:Protein of unknown function (DUF1326)